MSDDINRSGGSLPDEQSAGDGKDSYERAVPVENISGMTYEQHPNRAGRDSGRPGTKKKRSGKGKAKKKVSSRQVHIDRSEPLQFGSGAAEEAARVKKGSVWKKIIIILLVLILLFVIFANIMIFRYISKFTQKDTGTRLFTTASLKSDNIQNILLIGSDFHAENEKGRSDSVILLSMDSKKDKITMTSFMRDSYVMLPEYDLDGDGAYFGEGDKCKLNAAYAYGGPELLMDTIEYNFDVHVEKYMLIEPLSFVDIIDSVGGIELDITDEEAQGMRAPMYQQNKLLGNPWSTDYLSCGGNGIRVNGNQALGYARLRYVGNADFQRTERQRIVLKKVLEKLNTLSIFGLDDFACSLASAITTNLSKWELYKLIVRGPFLMKYDIAQLRIPDDGEFGYGTGNDGSSVLTINFASCIETLNREIYE